MEKKISYLNRTYSDYKDALIAMSERYYPDLANSFRDSSVASWQIDLTADIADNLSYHIDRAFQETNINSAQEKASLYAIARNNGVKIPGPKAAVAEVKITAILNESDGSDGPIIRRGTKFSSGSQDFELLDDVDFKEQFDKNGVSDRTIIPKLNTNGIIDGYAFSKLAIVRAGDTRIFSLKITESDVKPFMEVILPIEGVMGIESILVVDGSDNSLPTYGTFYGSGCSNVKRFYEVDSLVQNKCWLDKGGESEIDVNKIVKGEWRPIKHKFITEYTDKGYLKIIFGASHENEDTIQGISSNNIWEMSRIMNNENLGILPSPNTVMHILYRVGGGSSSNVAKGAINRISYLNADFPKGSDSSKILQSLKVENTTPSISGKDMPNEQEMKYYIKYHNAAQERCVTVKDYIDRIMLLPAKYGTPFRVGVAEENNKIVISLLGIDNNKKLTTNLPSMLVENIKDYLSEYKMIGDFIEIKPGEIINLGFDIEAIIDKNYNGKDVIASIISKVEEYMDINRHMMGEEIYIGDLQKEVGKIDGVLNLISIKVSNMYSDYNDNKYSSSRIKQPLIPNSNYIDLEASDWVLYNDGDSMMEIKNPDRDITVKIKMR